MPLQLLPSVFECSILQEPDSVDAGLNWPIPRTLTSREAPQNSVPQFVISCIVRRKDEGMNPLNRVSNATKVRPMSQLRPTGGVLYRAFLAGRRGSAIPLNRLANGARAEISPSGERAVRAPAPEVRCGIYGISTSSI